MATITFRNAYDTVLFTDIYDTYDKFYADYGTIMGNLTTTSPIKVASIKSLYYLLYARYGNNPIANFDLNQWKYKLFAIILMHGGKWEKQLEIQDKLRGLTEDEILMGSKQIYNHAFNPSTAPSTGTLEELEYINDQNTANNKKGKLEGYNILWSILHSNATEDFLAKFKPLFKIFVSPEKTLLYITEESED